MRATCVYVPQVRSPKRTRVTRRQPTAENPQTLTGGDERRLARHRFVVGAHALLHHHLHDVHHARGSRHGDGVVRLVVLGKHVRPGLHQRREGLQVTSLGGEEKTRSKTSEGTTHLPAFDKPSVVATPTHGGARKQHALRMEPWSYQLGHSMWFCAYYETTRYRGDS